ncbi:cytochrome P450 [Streptomyces sp. NPDC060184]|uniref:cytochrome P450 n=1 Tax=Streptomyces sp. NPDC060184 TaxID=3347064 RepID=UPI00365734AF
MLDVFGDYSSRDPALALAEAAKGCPLQEASENGGVYAFRAHDVQRALTSADFWSQRSSDQRLAALTGEDRKRRRKLKTFYSLWPVFSDGAYHQRVRHASIQLLRGTVTPELLAACRRLATSRLAAGVGESFDWADTVARPMAREAIAGLTGDADAVRLIELGVGVMDELATPRIDMARVDRALASVDALSHWLGRARTEPPTPFVAGLGELWDDPAFGPEAATALLTQVVTGAYEPITTALCVVGERVHGDVLARMPVPEVREEVLRLAAPFRFASRYARRPVSIGPHRLDAGARVNLCLGTSNLDPERYPGPLEIRDRGVRTRSLSFGAGAHYCPGAALARAVVDVLLESLKESGAHFHAERIDREPELPMLRYRTLEGRLVRTASTADCRNRASGTDSPSHTGSS